MHQLLCKAKHMLPFLFSYIGYKNRRHLARDKLLYKMQNASTIKSCDFSYSMIWFILLAFLISEPLHFHILFLIFKYWSTCSEWSMGAEGSDTTALWNCSVNTSLPFSPGTAFPTHPPLYYSCPWWLNISTEQLCSVFS